MKLKKFVSMLLAVVMLLALAACGGGDPGSENSNPGSNNSSAPSGGGEIWECVVPWPSLGFTPEGMGDIEAAINAISEPEIGVHVTLEPIFCFDLNSQQTLMISTGTKLDLCLIMLETNASYVNNGTILDITDIYKDNAPHIQATLGDAVEAGTINHRLYSIPTGNIRGNSYGFGIRTDLFEKYAKDKSKKEYTIDELGELFAAIQAGEGAGFYAGGGLVTHEAFFRFDELGASASSGVLMLDGDTDTIVNMYATDTYMQYAKKVYEWAQAGYLVPDATSTDGGAEQIKAGRIGGQFLSTQPGQDAWLAQSAGVPITLLHTVHPAYGKTNSLSNISFGISANCKNPAKAMQLIDLMFADNDIGTILTSGLENKSYVVKEKDSDGNMIIAYPEGQTSDTVPYYNMFGVWPNAKAQLEPTTIDFFPELKAYNDGMVYSPAFGYTFDASDYSTQMAAIDSVVAQYQETIQGGKADPESVIPAFLRALEDAGINEVIAANQKQYDAWKSGN